MEIVVGAVSDKGNVKETNQDNFLIKICEDKTGDVGLFVMCDGMGGLSHGEVASSIAVKYFKDWFYSEYETIIGIDNESEIFSLMCGIMECINKKIINYGEQVQAKVGTTISSLLICKNKYYIVHVGDSRVYKIDKKIKQLTEDHTFVAMSVRNKTMTREEAKNNPRKNVLTQCIGVKENIDIYKTFGKIYKNDIFVLCCDGFYNKFEEDELCDEIKKVRSVMDNDILQESAEKFVRKVKERGERDNISLIIVGFDPYEDLISRIKKHIGFGNNMEKRRF
jgi:protein phosphatase